MHSHVQQALDGEMDRFRLSDAEREELRQAEDVIGAVLQAIPSQPLPDLSSVILARIRERDSQLVQVPVSLSRNERRAQRSGIADWLWRRRSITFRPAYALAAGVVAMVIGSQAIRSGQGAPQAPLVFTQFVLRAPDANKVSLAGDFTAWQPTYTMTRAGQDGVWTVVIPLEPGVHTYAFVVDGERWTPDPMAPSIDDGFGGVNSRVAVLTPDARKL